MLTPTTGGGVAAVIAAAAAAAEEPICAESTYETAKQHIPCVLMEMKQKIKGRWEACGDPSN